MAGSLASAVRRIAAADDVTSASADLVRRFPPPERADPASELGRALAGQAGRGLFGCSDVWVTEAVCPLAASVLSRRPGQSATAAGPGHDG